MAEEGCDKVQPIFTRNATFSDVFSSQDFLADEGN